MDTPPRYPEPDDDSTVGPRLESTKGTSLWVYAVWIIGIALILLLVVLHLTGTIGPGLHGVH